MSAELKGNIYNREKNYIHMNWSKVLFKIWNNYIFIFFKIENTIEKFAPISKN
jgi:hypothetical protein